MSIILGCHYSSAVEFFRCFLPQVKALPPLSLSTYWSTIDLPDAPAASVVGIAETWASHDATCTEVDIPILPVAELSYLSTAQGDATKTTRSQTSALEMEYTMQLHDPVGVVQKMFDAAQCLCASLAEVIDARDKAALLEFEITVAVKSGRASLLLSCASSLASSDSLMNGSYLDNSLLEDLSTYVTSRREAAERAGTEKRTAATTQDVDGELLRCVDTSTRLDGTKTDAYSVLRDRVLR